MGAATRIDIHGAKGGESSPKQPTEAADSLRSTNLAKILIAVGEGEFDGTPTARDVHLDNTPIADANGNINFPIVKWEWRPGSIDQSYIPGIPSVESETTVNVELRSDNAWVRSLTNTQLSAGRVRLAWPALQRQDDEGNLGGYRIEYVVEVATDGGAYQMMLTDTVDGKTTTRYERSRRIDLPKATSGWQLRIRRLTPNQNTNKIADTMLLAGYTAMTAYTVQNVFPWRLYNSPVVITAVVKSGTVVVEKLAGDTWVPAFTFTETSCQALWLGRGRFQVTPTGNAVYETDEL